MKKRVNIPVFKKKYKYLYSKMLDKELIKRAYFKMRKGKRKRKRIREIDAHLDKYIDMVYEIIENSKPNAKNPKKGFEPPKHSPVKIHESGKDRIIYVPGIIEQWIHHIIMQVLTPILLNRFHPNSYGSIPKKGLHKGAKQFVIYQHNYKYAYKFDIRHFYGSVRKDVLEKILREMIEDEWMIAFILRCFKWHSKGLPLGFYLSQWLSNVVLTSVDWMIAESGVKHIRYVDDAVLFSNNKTRLFALVRRIKKYIGEYLRLKLKNNRKLIILGREKVSFLGFVFADKLVRLRGRVKKNIIKVASRIKKNISKNRPIWVKDARRILSALGWIECSNSYMFYIVHIEPMIKIKKMRNIVSKYDKKVRICSYDKVDESRIRLCG